MKTIKWMAFSAVVSMLFFTACQKDIANLANSEQIVASEDQTTVTDLSEDVDDQADEAIETRGGGGGACPVVTVEPADGSYPRTVTIDFGSEGCEGPNGRVRKGKMIVTVTDTMINAGATRTVTFVDFFVDDAQIEGTKTLTNLGVDAEGNLTFNRTVIGGKITFPNGETTTWEANHTIAQVAGGGTPTPLDNVFEITGNSSGVNRHGKAYSAEIIEPLIKKRSCPWIVAGVKLLTIEDKTVTIDFGDGDCDRKAVATLPDGTQKEIMLHRRW